MPRSWDKPSDFKGWAVFALGLFFILFGVPLLIGGFRLITLGGSWYYLPAGIAFISSGSLLMLRRRLGATVYGASCCCWCSRLCPSCGRRGRCAGLHCSVWVDLPRWWSRSACCW